MGSDNLITEALSPGTLIRVVPSSSWKTVKEALSPFEVATLETQGFDGSQGGASGFLMHADGSLKEVILVEPTAFWDYASVAARLSAGVYHLGGLDEEKLYWASFGWGLASYRFDRYKKASLPKAKLVIGQNQEELLNLLEATFLVRDLINTPPNDLGTTAFAEIIESVARRFGANVTHVQGADIEHEFPLVYAVGKAGATPPRLLTLTWGDRGHKKVSLVGKGVCFDTGGLNIKASSGMLLMKKDMGGAAHVLGLAQLLMAQKVPLYLEVVIPLVENSIGPHAMRPSDIYPSRLGKTVEIGNTDAEGRLILADALAYAVEKKPDILIDFATLTGAMRVALGEELPGFFTNQPLLAEALMQASEAVSDPLWQIPLYAPYRVKLKSSIADLNNIAAGEGAGDAIMAALFMEEFVGTTPWIHLDMMAWNRSSKPGRLQGGEAMGMRAIYHMLKTWAPEGL